MTNRLKSLELNGYKTFASKTNFEFAGNITAVVGPNGSGKSNIADALRWVLGEQSFRLLRGRKTDDMIFSGSETRSRAGMASATVTFDNRDGWLPIDFSEVSITRRAYRDGQNEYLINNQRVRLRDVSELLATSGLAERTYTVIGQGLVDAALTLKAEERRRLFEEAAGIGLYRTRKEQAQRRLENTRRNLERVEDILSELTPRLRSLQRQARRAEEYEQVRADLQEVLREWYGYHWHQAQTELQETRRVVAEHEENLKKVHSVQSGTEQELAGLRDRINSLRGQLNAWHRQLSQIHSRREETSRELAVSGERRRSLQEQEAQSKTEITRLEEELTRQQTRLDEYTRRVDEAVQNASVAEKELKEARAALEARRTERRDLENAVRDAQQQINLHSAKNAELLARKSELEARLGRLQNELQENAKTNETLAAQVETLENQTAVASREKEQVAEKRQKAQQLVDRTRQSLEKLREQRSQTQAEITQMTGEITRMKAEYEVLVEAEESHSGYATGAKLLLDAAKAGRLNRNAGALGSQLQVPEGFEVAIAAALGDYVDAILLGDGQESDTALNLLEGELAKAALLPLNQLSPLQALTAPKEQGCLGVAADMVDVPAELRPAIDLLLGQVLVVEDRVSARRVLRGKENHVRAVTLKGEVFHGSGAILVDTGARAATLRRPRQRKSLSDQIQKTEEQMANLTSRLDSLNEQETRSRQELAELTLAAEQAEDQVRKAEQAYQNTRLEFDKATSQLAWQQRQQESLAKEIELAKTGIVDIETQARTVAENLDAAQDGLKQASARLGAITVEEQLGQVSYWEAQLSLGQQAVNDARQTYQERKQTLDQVQTRLDEQMARAGQVKARLVELDWQVEEMRSSEGGIGDQIQELNTLIEPAEAELSELEALQSQQLTHETDVRQKTNIAERYYNQAQIALARRQESLDTLRQRIEVDFGLVEFEYTSDMPGPAPLPFGDVVQRLPVVTEVSPDLEDALKQQRMHLRRLGAVNPDAQREYREVKERHEFLTSQLEDLRGAERDVHAAISELDALMDQEFRRTFDVVAREFKEIFTRLFDGGAARLVLTEGDELNEIGIDIEARLPGKRTQELALLSGGERSLTAAALVFALIKASPTPFCIMDEVDAMLDEANVGRFRQVLMELSKGTQFVLITHNRHTVQAADVIYGITMGRDTTSQTISLKLEEVDDRYSSA